MMEEHTEALPPQMLTSPVPRPYSNVMEPIEDPVGDGFDDEVIHDQLPSVDEAKANADLTGAVSKPNRRCFRICMLVCCCLCCLVILILVLAVVVAQSETQDVYRNQQHHGGHGMATLAPGTFEPRVDFVREFLSSFSDAHKIMQEGSPQFKASRWIADEDTFHLPTSDASFVERYALAVIYFAMDGPKWPTNLGFLSPKRTCDWNIVGFGSDDKPRYVGAYCQRPAERVEQLFFRELRICFDSIGKRCLLDIDSSHFPNSTAENWLRGEFPEEIALLEDLKHISVYHNPGVGGAFPGAVRNIPKLEYLAMHFCALEGPIPTWIGEMTSLTGLVLSNNDLTGRMNRDELQYPHERCSYTSSNRSFCFVPRHSTK
jgi:hypothetical protein